MKLEKKIILLLSISLMTLLLVIGCGTTSRYKADEYGPKQEGNMEKALANMDKAMGDMEATNKIAMAKQMEALKLGKVLFNDPDLGKKGLSCNSCHPGGGSTGGEAEIKKKMGHGPYKLPIPSLIGASARFPKYKVSNDEVIVLPHMVNNCVRMFMGGKRMPLNSPELFYLSTYVSAFSNGEEIEVVEGK